LAASSSAGAEVTLRIEPREEALSIWIHPSGRRPVPENRPGASDGLGFERIAARLVDAFEVVRLDGKDWLHLEKRAPANSAES
jgi:hypothetical protein